MAKSPAQPIIARLVTTGAALLAAAVAQRVIAAAWTKAKGHKPPSAADDELGIGIGEVVAAAMITGAVAAAARVLATRSAGKVTAKFTSDAKA